MAAFSFGFAWIVHFEFVEVWHVFAYAIVSGMCLSITQPMRQTLIANTVPRHLLGNAYATNVLTIPGTRAIGPFIGGIIVATLGFFWNFTIESLLYVGMILTFLPMRTPYASVGRRRPAAGAGSFLTDLLEGFRYIWSGNRVLFFLLTLTIVPNVILQPVIFSLPLFTFEILERGADVGGYMLAINGFGGLLMALLIASFGFFFRRGLVCLVTAIASSVLALALTQAVWLPVALLVIALFASTQTAFRTTNGTLTQTWCLTNCVEELPVFRESGRGSWLGLACWWDGSRESRR